MVDKQLTSKFFITNRDKLFNSLSVDILIVTANGLLQKNADEAFPFRQDSSFWYLTGLNYPDLILVKTKTEEFLIIPDFFIKRQSIIKPINNSDLSKTSGLVQIVDEKVGWHKLKGLISAQIKTATLLPNPVLLKRHGIYTNPARRQLVNRLKRLSPKTKIIDARTELAKLRMAKQPIEIEIIQKAIDITNETLTEVLANSRLQKYQDSAQIERDILAGFLLRGADGHGFDPIVASGADASFFHFAELGRPLKTNQLMYVDVGARYSFYTADITRTVSIGEPSTRQQAVYEAVRYVQSEAYKLIKPGINFKDYEQQVEKIMGVSLKELGLIAKLDRKSIRRYYPHYCSHSLGLDAHDSADYSQPLPENMVMTVEPGIYIKEEGIGVRIEDVVRITKNAHKLMSSKLPVSLKL